jgi:hypothetical protein
MTERLREELLRVGENVAPLHVPGDLWARGRRARRRDRLVSGGVVLSVVGLIFAISVAGWPGMGGGGNVAPVAPGGDQAGAVPSTLYALPERLLVDNPGDGASDWGGAQWSPDVAETDLSIGRASVAFAAKSMGGVALPVVVTAADGAYHPLVLPGWSPGNLVGFMNQAHDVALALSPDGRSLAYPWWDPTAPLDGPMPSGLRIVDLVTGELREIPLLGQDGVYATNVAWSPDSRWLVWRGEALPKWTPETVGGGEDVAGRVAPGATVSEAVPLPARRQTTAVAISNDGVVALFAPGRRWQTWDGEEVAQGKAGFPEGGGSAAYSPDGTSVALSTRLDAYGEPQPGTSWFLDPRSGKLSERPLAEGLDLYPDGAEFRPLGWISDHLVVAMVSPAEDTVGMDRRYDARIVVMTAPSQPRSRWTYRLLTGFEQSMSGPFAGHATPPYADTVSVAVDLMTLENPAGEFPPPDWPWSDESKALIVGLCVAGLLGCLLLGRRWLRGSHHTLGWRRTV